ncbi:hypothetical protein B0O80DRAFT_111249 [Mortierella sp. GBAus27b]|nr:hypothetical protein B0O80DRAFT_111249 [Mortierella sp. GBAus27b]
MTDNSLIPLLLIEIVSSEVENHIMTDKARRRGDYYPKYIYYCASETEAARFRSKYAVFESEGLTPEGRYIVEKSSEAATKIEKDVQALGADIRLEVKQEIDEIKELLRALLIHTGTPMPPSLNTRQRSESRTSSIGPRPSSNRHRDSLGGYRRNTNTGSIAE